MATCAAGGTGKLRVGEAVIGALTGLFSNIPALILMSWPWLLLVGVTSYVVTLQIAGWLAATPHRDGMPTANMPAYINALNIMLQVLAALGGAVMAVGWHRLALLGERASPASALPGAAALRYVGVLLLIFLSAVLPIVFAIGLVMGLLGTDRLTGPAGLALVAVIVIAVTCAFALAMRMSMVLAARSIGDNTLRFRDSIRATRGNTVRLLFGALLTLVVPLSMMQVVTLPLLGGVTPGVATGPEAWADAIRHFALPSSVITVLSMMIAMLFISFLSSAYRHFFADRVAALTP